MFVVAHPLARFILIRLGQDEYLLRAYRWISREFTVMKATGMSFELLNGSSNNRVSAGIQRHINRQITVEFDNGHVYHIRASTKEKFIPTLLDGIVAIHLPLHPIRYMSSFMEDRILSHVANNTAQIVAIDNYVFVAVSGELLCCIPLDGLNIELTDESVINVADDGITLDTGKFINMIHYKTNHVPGYRCANALRYHIMPDGAFFNTMIKPASVFYYVEGNLVFTDIAGAASIDRPAGYWPPSPMRLDVYRVIWIYTLDMNFVALVVDGRELPIIFQIPAGEKLLGSASEPHTMTMGDSKYILSQDGVLRNVNKSYEISLLPAKTTDESPVRIIPCKFDSNEFGQAMYRTANDKLITIDGINPTQVQTMHLIFIGKKYFVFANGSLVR